MLLNVPYESDPSDLPEWAGARVLRMILRSVGVPDQLPDLPLTADLYTYARSRNDAVEGASGFWAIDPQGMCQTLMDKDPRVAAGQTSWVIYDGAADQKAADNQLVDTITIYQTAPAALTQDGHHWVCVTGFELNAGGQLTTFYVSDPAWTSGGPQPISLTAWDNFFTKVVGGTRWLMKHVEVGDPHPAVRTVPRGPRLVKRPGDVIISSKDIVALAVEGVREIAQEAPELIKAVEGGHAGTPLLVAAANMEGTWYYLLPFMGQGADTTAAAVIVDARYGDVWSAKALGENFRLVRLQHDDVRRHLTARPLPVRENIGKITSRILDDAYELTRGRHEASGPAGQHLRRRIERELAGARHSLSYLHVRPDTIEILPHLVWRPCYGASSPFFPYYVARVGDRSLYVNAHTGDVTLNWDLCWWYPLGA